MRDARQLSRMTIVINDEAADELVVLHPTGTRVLVRVLEEDDEPHGILLPTSYTKGAGRSMQGLIIAVGMAVSDPEILEAFRRQTPVVFDDQADSPWWKGSMWPNYLGAVLDVGAEYVLIPADGIVCMVEDDDAGNEGEQPSAVGTPAPGR